MHIVMIDNSIPFDGYTPARKAMGGAEKAFASLPGALVKAGHRVTVFNNCKHPVMAEGARWQRLDGKRPSDADAVIAFRKVSLLQSYRSVKKKILWVAAAPDYLTHPSNKEVADSINPTFVFLSESHRHAWQGSGNYAVIPPGVRREYLPSPEGKKGEGEEEPQGPRPPVAVVTTHPLHGLDWVLDEWKATVRPQVPDARLQVFSNALARDALDSDPEGVDAIRQKARRMADDGVVITRPEGDRAMAGELKHARVHLYPAHDKDFACWTLRESQAAGVPAVAMAQGGVEDVVHNGETGFIVPDRAALGNVAVQLLQDDSLAGRMSEAAALPARLRTWEAAAQDFLALLD